MSSDVFVDLADVVATVEIRRPPNNFFGGEEAYSFGLCDQLVPTAEIRGAAVALATDIASVSVGVA